jgi:hypothetical protein
MDEDVQRAIAALDEDPDEGHLDQTPAVRELAGMGLRAVGPLTEPLLGDARDRRLHAQRAWEAVVYDRHGWVAGRGFPDDESEAAAIADLREVGYGFDDEPDERAAAVRRLRAWLARESS